MNGRNKVRYMVKGFFSFFECSNILTCINVFSLDSLTFLSIKSIKLIFTNIVLRENNTENSNYAH